MFIKSPTSISIVLALKPYKIGTYVRESKEGNTLIVGAPTLFTEVREPGFKSCLNHSVTV